MTNILSQSQTHTINLSVTLYRTIYATAFPPSLSLFSLDLLTQNASYFSTTESKWRKCGRRNDSILAPRWTLAFWAAWVVTWYSLRTSAMDVASVSSSEVQTERFSSGWPKWMGVHTKNKTWADRWKKNNKPQRSKDDQNRELLWTDTWLAGEGHGRSFRPLMLSTRPTRARGMLERRGDETMS